MTQYQITEQKIPILPLGALAKIKIVLKACRLLWSHDAGYVVFRKDRSGSFVIEEQATLRIERKL